METSLNGHVALVTGASRGIGRGIAKSLGEAGATVIGTATSQQGADKLSQYLAEHQIHGGTEVLNVADPDSITSALSTVRERFGDISILVNNAGITRDNLLMRMKDEEWDDLIQTNLTSVFRLSKQCLRPMMKARWGRVINITSIVGVTGNAGQANYAAAKAGVIGFTKSMAKEVASRGITVNAIAPGFIETDMTSSLTEEQQQAIAAQIPMARMGQAEDIGAAVLFLASAGASYITGETLHVNGGMLMD
ncbi:MAG TPA: 3-oxoacyl-ACP reductase [Gammaproteobacteria bacterium]|nr:3-oxoacyl-ACP reductase [Gammaproteobacteria bacterium]